MSRSICFTRLAVRVMPGYPRGGLDIDELAPGINVIYGPNAAGKTTLARAMQRLLQPAGGQDKKAWVIGDLVIGDQEYELEYQLGHVTCRSGGDEGPVPALAPPAVGQRYMLALHDLVQKADEREIVQQIQQEAAGGYDIAAAAEKLGFLRSEPARASIKECKELDESRKKTQQAAKNLEEIELQERDLGELRQQARAAEAARQQEAWIAKALDALDKRAALVQAERTAEVFHSSLAKMNGSEWSRLAKLKQDIDEIRERLVEDNQKLLEGERQAAKTGLPDEGVSRDTINTLQQRCETLRNLTTEIDRLGNELARAEAEQQDFLRRLGEAVTVENLAQLDLTTLDELSAFVRDAEAHRTRHQAAEEASRWLSTGDAEGSSVDDLRDGMQLLQRWLAAPRATATGSNTKREWLIAAGITALLSVAMAFVHLSWLTLLVPAAGMLAWAFRSRQDNSASIVAELEREWKTLGLDSPATWNRDEVETRLRELQREHGVAQLAEEKQQRRADIEDRRQALEASRRELDLKRAAWIQRLQIDIEIDDVLLHSLAATVLDAQDAARKATAARAQLDEKQQKRDTILRTVRAELVPFSDISDPDTSSEENALDVDRARGLVADLEQRQRDHQQGIEQQGRARSTIDDYKKKLGSLTEEKQQLFIDLGLKEGDELTLQGWCDVFQDYQGARKALMLAKRDADNAKSDLGEEVALLEQTREQLEAEQEGCRQKALGLEDLNQRIGDITGRVDRAKRDSALEHAMANEERCRRELEAARDRDAHDLVGNVLFDLLSTQQLDVQQHAVLKQANKLFARITHGRFRLNIKAGNPPEFRAINTMEGGKKPLPLDALSSGTRLQLLLAVRVAFVQQQEQGQQLPLILDETLGNSDEQRARNIIEAALEIARGGRQVFYFTAQHDELAKWRRILQEMNVPHREIDLARQLQFSETEFAPDVITVEPPPSQHIPTPEGESWMEYGRRLSLAPIERRGDVGGLDLWYVVDDVDTLYRLLSHDINKWGQLRNLVELGSVEGLRNSSPVYQRAAANARLMEHLLRLWQQGRGQPVDYIVIEESPAVSESFVDDMATLAATCDGDARRLIETLRDNGISRFGAKKIDKLEGYLTEHGYLDPQPIRSEEEIREAVATLVFDDRESGLLSDEHYNYLIAAVIQGESTVEETAEVP